MESLLERERELAAVDELLERGGAVLVEGGAGIGKTATSGGGVPACGWRWVTRCLRARGSELEAGFAFGVVRQLFERRLASAEDERARRVAGWAGWRGATAAVGRASGARRRSTRRLRCCTGSTG